MNNWFPRSLPRHEREVLAVGRDGDVPGRRWTYPVRWLQCGTPLRRLDRRGRVRDAASRSRPSAASGRSARPPTSSTRSRVTRRRQRLVLERAWHHRFEESRWTARRRCRAAGACGSFSRQRRSSRTHAGRRRRAAARVQSGSRSRIAASDVGQPSSPSNARGPSASRRARSRTPRCRCACRPAAARLLGAHVGGACRE